MSNPVLGQVLGSVFANAMAGRARAGPFRSPDVGVGALSVLVGGLIGRGQPMSRRRTLGKNRSTLLVMLLPFAMRWVQRNGGVGAVLERFKQKGYGHHTKSWLSTGTNSSLETEAIDHVVGREDLSVLARQLGVEEAEVSSGLAEIFPEVVDQLSPEGRLPPEADEALDAGVSTLEAELNEIQTGVTP